MFISAPPKLASQKREDFPKFNVAAINKNNAFATHIRVENRTPEQKKAKVSPRSIFFYPFPLLIVLGVPLFHLARTVKVYTSSFGVGGEGEEIAPRNAFLRQHPPQGSAAGFL